MLLLEQKITNLGKLDTIISQNYLIEKVRSSLKGFQQQSNNLLGSFNCAFGKGDKISSSSFILISHHRSHHHPYYLIAPKVVSLPKSQSYTLPLAIISSYPQLRPLFY